MANSRIILFVKWIVIVMLSVSLILYVVYRPEWAKPIMMMLGAAYIVVRLFDWRLGRRHRHCTEE